MDIFPGDSDGAGRAETGIGAAYPGIGAAYPGIGAAYPGIGAAYPGIGAAYPGFDATKPLFSGSVSASPPGCCRFGIFQLLLPPPIAVFFDEAAGLLKFSLVVE